MTRFVPRPHSVSRAPSPRLPSWVLEAPFAHRGLHDLEAGVPENTLAAFDAAVEAGYAIELDVRQLGDGTVVVFHDGDLRRACGVDKRLRELGRSDVAALRVFGSEQGIPTLDDVLSQVAGRVPLLVEVKKGNHDDGIESRTWTHLSGYRGPFAVQSFRPSAVRWFRNHAPEAVRGQLAGPLEYEGIPRWRRFFSRRLLGVVASCPDFINYDLHALPDPWVTVVSRLAAAPVLCWTVKSEDDRRKAERMGVNYVFDNVRP